LTDSWNRTFNWKKKQRKRCLRADKGGTIEKDEAVVFSDLFRTKTPSLGPHLTHRTTAMPKNEEEIRPHRQKCCVPTTWKTSSRSTHFYQTLSNRYGFREEKRALTNVIVGLWQCQCCPWPFDGWPPRQPTGRTRTPLNPAPTSRSPDRPATVVPSLDRVVWPPATLRARSLPPEPSPRTRAPQACTHKNKSGGGGRAQTSTCGRAEGNTQFSWKLRD